MNKIKKKIITIGGGGFTHKSDPALDEFVISQCKKDKIRFGFLPTASKDDPVKIDNFYQELKKKLLQLVVVDLHINLIQL